MKVKMLRSPAKDLGCSLMEGETGEVQQSVGERLVAFGIAECLDDPKPKAKAKKVEAIPGNPTISESKQPEISGSQGSGGSDFDSDPKPSTSPVKADKSGGDKKTNSTNSPSK